MKKRLVCILLAAVLTLGTMAGMPIQASADSAMTASEACVELLKALEGFSAKPYWDNSQYTVGYGTRCPDEDYARYCEEGISEEEALELLALHIGYAETSLNSLISKYSLTLTQNQFDALVSFTFNLGGGWVNQDSYLRRAIIEGKTGNDFLLAISLWCKAGSVQNYLIERRLKEANVYLNGVYSTKVPANYCYVRYDGNGGTVDFIAQGYDSDTSPAPAGAATYEGKEFLGWFTAKSGGTKITALDSSTNGRILYAQWADENSGGSGSSGDTTPTDPEETVPEETVPEETVPPTQGGNQNVSVAIKVTADVVNVRSGPGTGYSVVTTVKEGQTMTITETAEGSGYTWGKYERGWICLKYTNYDEAVNGNAGTEEPADKVIATGTVYNAGGSLRIRSSAGTSSSIVGYLSNGAKVEIFEKKTVGSEEWGRIAKGWISLDYVLLDSSAEEEPLPEETTPETTPPETQPEETDPEAPGTTQPETSPVQTGTVIDAAGSLRIRSSAGTSGSVVGYLYNGDRVEILEKTTVNGVVWGRISKGWISLDYVKLDSSGDSGNSNTVIDTGTVINANSLRVRSAPGTDKAVLGYLTMGTRVQIYETQTIGSMVWGRIDQGWISLDYVKLDSASSGDANTRTVIASSLRIRSAAGANNPIVGYLSNGAKVTILETTTVGGVAWGRIDKGWICMDYVK